MSKSDNLSHLRLIRGVLTAALCGALFLTVNPSPAAGQNGPWRYTFTFAPSFLAPRLDAFNAALATEGLNLIDAAYIVSAQRIGEPAPTSFGYRFPQIRYAYGASAGILYDLNEELRGGLSINVDAGTSDATVAMSHSGTNYLVSQKTSLPLVSISVSLHKVFRFEEDPRLQLYLGGWGSLGNLFGHMEGSVQPLDAGLNPVDSVSYSANLDAMGWGAGGVAGVEFKLKPRYMLFAEGGFGYFLLENVDLRSDMVIPGYALENTVPLENSAGRPIDLDFTGVFLRLGVRAALGRADLGPAQ